MEKGRSIIHKMHVLERSFLPGLNIQRAIPTTRLIPVDFVSPRVPPSIPRPTPTPSVSTINPPFHTHTPPPRLYLPRVASPRLASSRLVSPRLSRKYDDIVDSDCGHAKALAAPLGSDLTFTLENSSEAASRRFRDAAGEINKEKNKERKRGTV